MSSDDQNVTPEEKLLRVIQQSKAEAPKPTPPPATVASRSPNPSPVSPPAASAKAAASPVTAEDKRPLPVPERKLKMATEAPPAKPMSPPPPKSVSAPAVVAAVPAPAESPAQSARETPVLPEAETPASDVATPEPRRGRWTGWAAGGWAAFRPHGASVDSAIRMLWAIILVMFVLVLYDTLFVKPGVIPTAAAGAEEGMATSEPLRMPELPPLDQVVDPFLKRNIFQPFGAAGGGTTKAETAGAPGPADFKLIGVSWDPGSEAESVAIIRDEKKKATFFLKEGQSVGETDIVVARVARDRVVLKQQGKEMELR